MTQVVASYVYSFCGLSRRADTIRRLREQQIRNVERLEGRVVNGYMIDRVAVADRASSYAQITIHGHVPNIPLHVKGKESE